MKNKAIKQVIENIENAVKQPEQTL